MRLPGGRCGYDPPVRQGLVVLAEVQRRLTGMAATSRLILRCSAVIHPGLRLDVDTVDAGGPDQAEGFRVRAATGVAVESTHRVLDVRINPGASGLPWGR